MKAIFGIFALFLVAANAGIIEEPINYEGLINGIIHESKQLAAAAIHELEHQAEEIILAPLHRVEDALNSIIENTENGAICVVAQTIYAETVVSDMHDELNNCVVVAAKDSAQIVGDVVSSAEQLVVGGYGVLKTLKKCRAYTNSLLQRTCYTRLSIQVALYVKNARTSIQTLKGAPKRVPLVFTDADTCTHNAAEKALTELEEVQRTIDGCVH